MAKTSALNASGRRRPWHADVPCSTRLSGDRRFGVIGAMVMTFGVWGATAPIAGAVVTTACFCNDRTEQNRAASRGRRHSRNPREGR